MTNTNPNKPKTTPEINNICTNCIKKLKSNNIIILTIIFKIIVTPHLRCMIMVQIVLTIVYIKKSTIPKTTCSCFNALRVTSDQKQRTFGKIFKKL